MQLITLIMYNTYWIISILSNLYFVKDFLKMDQGGESIHRINKLSTLKPFLEYKLHFVINIIMSVIWLLHLLLAVTVLEKFEKWFLFTWPPQFLDYNAVLLYQSRQIIFVLWWGVWDFADLDSRPKSTTKAKDCRPTATATCSTLLSSWRYKLLKNDQRN